MAGVKLTHVPYKGTAGALNDLMGGQIQMMFGDSLVTCRRRRKDPRAGGDLAAAPSAASGRADRR